MSLKINGPAGSDILINLGGQKSEPGGGALLPNSKRKSVIRWRTGIFGLVLVICIVDRLRLCRLTVLAAGQVVRRLLRRRRWNLHELAHASGIKVGKASAASLAGDSARITFTVDRHVAVGDESLAVIGTHTILGERSVSVSRGTGKATSIPLSRMIHPDTLAGALEDLGQNANNLNKPQSNRALMFLTDTLHDATPDLRGALDGVTSLSRTLNRRDEALQSCCAREVGDVGAVRSRRTGRTSWSTTNLASCSPRSTNAATRWAS